MANVQFQLQMQLRCLLRVLFGPNLDVAFEHGCSFSGILPLGKGQPARGVITALRIASPSLSTTRPRTTLVGSFTTVRLVSKAVAAGPCDRSVFFTNAGVNPSWTTDSSNQRSGLRPVIMNAPLASVMARLPRSQLWLNDNVLRLIDCIGRARSLIMRCLSNCEDKQLTSGSADCVEVILAVPK
jgi:hypothetical protein